MKRVIYFAMLLVALVSCNNNVKSVVYQDHGREVVIEGMRDVYIALGRRKCDSTFAESINFGNAKFYGKIREVSADSMHVVTEYNGMPMVIELKEPIKKRIVFDGWQK